MSYLNFDVKPRATTCPKNKIINKFSRENFSKPTTFFQRWNFIKRTLCNARQRETMYKCPRLYKSLAEQEEPGGQL